MIGINDLKIASCFNSNEHEENLTKIKVVQFKKDDDLNNCLLVPCHYWTSSEEIAQTVKHTPPIEVDPMMSFPPFEVKTFQIFDSSFFNSIIQRTFFYNKKWRRCHLILHGGVWGEWINIDNIINDILNLRVVNSQAVWYKKFSERLTANRAENDGNRFNFR
jgi:hypothetical protein